VDGQIKKMLDNNQVFKNTTAILTTVPGVGIGTACTLIACCPELGKVKK